MKRVTITFDYEGAWGMSHHQAPYDLAVTTGRLLDLLDKFDAKAVFFVTGKLVEEYPEVIRGIHERGHEIGFHGFKHEHMHELNAAQMSDLATNLASMGELLKGITGYRPLGFRAPYLMGPKFYDPAVYASLAGVGFSWVSNREIRWPNELARPDRLTWLAGFMKPLFIQKALLVLLNLKLISVEKFDRSPRVLSGLKWLLGERAPFKRPEGLLEYPLYSPLDCDLVSFPLPQDDSGAAFVAYASGVLKSCYDQSGAYFNLNCHDWITGTRDRLQILENALTYIAAHPDAQYFLPGLEGDAK